MECIGQLTYVEPVVEGVDKTKIVTNTCKFFEIDLYSCKKEDMAFSNKY
jgi:hypothetical protein